MKGAYPYVVDSSECIFGAQGQYYKKMDFSTVLNCEKRPTIIDLPPTKANDTNLGLIPNCCRNGTILPTWMDPTKSTSVFRMQVFKMEPDLNRSVINPPINFRINGTFNPDYLCGQPIQVSPSLFPDPTGLPVNTSAVASWQVVCNITQAKASTPKCCVSFSAYYNDSVVPCGTCACGCSSSTNQSQTCSAAAPAILLPSEALLVPFENRTALAVAWAELKHRTLPSPLPCSDNCGVSINWHVYSDYTRGWSARITVFNWDEMAFPDWFAAVELDKAAAGFQAMYSFNSTVLDAGSGNNTIVMQGKPGLNYLVAEAAAADPTKNSSSSWETTVCAIIHKEGYPRNKYCCRRWIPYEGVLQWRGVRSPCHIPHKQQPDCKAKLILLVAHHCSVTENDGKVAQPSDRGGPTIRP
ncbi:hypothetical protein MLD38_017970 [Melastoma candidum]|uniref:Uncharacterized protein n=1 Tax=Melastoma candidum TaxID=119954 RepID=A0ACB9QTN4_9MYRT|nr:hypothetical protein MLD38_017970 [Melastoma candidum]